MRLFTLILLVCLLSFTAGCTTSGNDIASPPMPELGQLNENTNLDDFTSDCRANMRIVAGQTVIYFATHGSYPETLEDMGMGEFFCPECGLQYSYSTSINRETQEPEYFLECPLPSDPNHGNVDNGVPSWTIEPAQGEDACRANMRTIASQCVIFFAGNERYPESLEEIGFGNIVCGDCGLPYQFTGDEKSFRVECPMPADPNHGFIDDGIVSWR